MEAAKSQAVFLSYASQDAEAVQRIAEALRAAGVEVWFDKNELVGGDAWDAKIRGQIANCALFVPVISAATQARREGYFRIEWKLAAQRTHAMADGTPFLLPVVIDGTRDAEALVPAEFRAVQWTRLPGGDGAEKFCARVGKLLREDSPAVGSDFGALTNGARGRAPLSRKPARTWWVPVIVGVAAAVALGVLIVQRSASPAKMSPAAATPPASLGEAAQLAARAKEIYTRSNYSREDLALAEDFARRATELESRSATAWGVRAGVQATYLYRGWDLGEKRMQATQGFAVRALGLNPDEPEALLAQGNLLRMRRAFPEAEAVLRHALEVDPANNRVSRTLQSVLKQENRVEEGRGLLQTAIARDPSDPLLRYDLAMSYADYGGNGGADPANVEAALVQLEAIPPDRTVASALLLKAALLAGWRADLGQMRAALGEMEKRPLAERMEDRAVYIAMWGALLQREPARAIAAAAVTTQNYFDDVAVPRRPKAWSLALAHLQADRQNLAQTEWRAAEAVLRQRVQLEPDNSIYCVELATTLAWLGRAEEARKELAPVEAAWSEELIPGRTVLLAQCYAALGDAPKTTGYLARGIDRSTFTTRKTVPLDPWWDKVKGAPEFRALYAEPGAVRAAAAPRAPLDEKSVAVLAFANRSEDRANEIFSDGISEELINVLGRVPGLTVKGRASSFFFKGSAATAQEKGQKLGATFLVDGSVRKSGNTVRITAQLIRAATDEVVWSSEPLLRDLKDVFAVQEEIAGMIAQALSLKLGVASAAAKAEVDPEAFRLYVEGRREWNRRLPAGYARAEQLLKRAIQLAPGFAQAHAALADVWELQGEWDNELGPYDQRDGELARRVRAKAREALSLDPQCAEAHASLGLVAWNSWRFAEGEEALRTALRINPSYASAHQWLGRNLMVQGRLDEALAALKRAADLDPLSPRILDNLAWALVHAGRLEEALAALDRALALQPDALQASSIKAQILARQGRRDEAMTLIRTVPAGVWISSHWRVTALGLMGDAEARGLLESYLTDRNAVTRFTALLFLGRGEEALRTLAPGQIESTRADVLLFDPIYDHVRADAAFTQALATIGLTEAHARAQEWRAAHPPKTAGK